MVAKIPRARVALDGLWAFAYPALVRGLLRLVRNVLGVLAGCVAVYVLVEGASSAFLLVWDLGFKTAGGLRSGRHVQFDEELGWTNIPNARLDDFYAPGTTVTIDGDSLRTTRDTTTATAATRVLCSGDSFTFGVGASDEQTWCHLLGRDPALSTRNAGEAAYGIGQMFLKGQRLSKTIDWDVQVFAFIADDIRRMTTSEFVGRNKPRFVLDGESAVLVAPTVEESSSAYAWFRANKRVFANLRVMELFGRLAYKLRGPPPPPPSDDEVARLAGALFEANRALNEKKNARAIYVFLPSGPGPDLPTITWRPRIAEECRRRGLTCYDLVEPFLRIDLETQHAMFEPLTHHYSARGNAWVASTIAPLVKTATTAR